MAKKRKTEAEKRNTIDTLLGIITAECENSGWYWEVNALDEKGFLSATVGVEKAISHQGISALINVVILENNVVQCRIERTSFHSYGITALFDAVNNALARAGYRDRSEKPKHEEREAIDILVQILRKFHVSVLQLTKRYNDRETLTISDEYDVQDFIHALLKIHFNDIRSEEYTPSYSGSSSRVDFLLKDKRILLEVKYATSRLKDNKIGEQLIVDIERYKKHPDCENLICFVYDPNFNIKNPYGLESDLSGKKGKLNIKVYVSPKSLANVGWALAHAGSWLRPVACGNALLRSSRDGLSTSEI